MTAQPFRRAVEDNAPVLHYIRVIGDLQRQRRILFDQQQRHAQIAANRLQPAEQFLDDQRCQALRQFVHQQQLRSASERRPDRQHLTLAAGEIPRLAAAQLGECREIVPDGIGQPALGVASRHHCVDVLRDSKVFEHLAAFRNQRDATRGHLVRWTVVDAFAAVDDGAVGHPRVIQADKAGDRAQRGGFSRPIGAEQRDDGAFGYRQRHTLHRGDHAVVGDLDFVELQQRRVHLPTGFCRKGHSRNQACTRRQIPTRPWGSNTRNRIIASPNAA